MLSRDTAGHEANDELIAATADVTHVVLAQLVAVFTGSELTIATVVEYGGRELAGHATTEVTDVRGVTTVLATAVTDDDEFDAND